MNSGREGASLSAGTREAAEALPHFRRLPGDPLVPTGQLGIAVATSGPRGSNAESVQWRLDGTFRVPRALAGPPPAGPEAVLRQIVVVMTYGFTHEIQARHAFRDELVFPEDVHDAGDVIEGSFHLDLLRTFDFIAPVDTYFISISIGPHLSEVVSREAHLPWLTPSLEDPSLETERDQEDPISDEPPEVDDGSWEVDDPL